MSERVCDFRSDTVTKPTQAMRRAMAEADVGDDVLDGDPTVGELEAHAARWLGKDGALFVPSGTMANQIAIGAWTKPGDEVIVERSAHILMYEAGGLGYLHGLQSVPLGSKRGAFDPEEVRAAIRPDYIHCPDTGLICVEQTHMNAGGRVVPLENLRAVHAVAKERDLPIHMDGARLANAVVAAGLPASEWASCADSVSVCLSKGLGAPVGSVVAGDAAFLEQARVMRKRLGGWMRQAGVIAAAGLVALRDGIERLAEDHALARELAVSLSELAGVRVSPEDVETNLVNVHVEAPEHDAPGLSRRLEEEGVRVMAFGPRTLRFVTHRDVGRADVQRVADALGRIL